MKADSRSRLAEKVIIVTGAASGIGAETVRMLSANGAYVAALDRDPSVRRMDGPGGGSSFIVDVSDAAALGEVIQEVKDKYQRVDGVVAAAGVTGYGTVHSTTLEQFEAVIKVNLTAIFSLAREVLPLMRQQRGGSFVAVASQLGLVGAADNLAYCASKGGVVNLVRALAIDHAAEGIRINAICPGPVRTPMLLQQVSRSRDGSTQVVQKVPMQRVGEPAEVAAAIKFLLSEDASFITGSVMTIDGGYSTQ